VTVKYGVTRLTIDRVHVGTWPAVSLHWVNVAEDGIRMSEICVTSSTIKMHTTGLTTDVRSMSVLSKNGVMRGIVTIMVPSMTNLTDSALPKEGAT
jgi:hypothetical protein